MKLRSDKTPVTPRKKRWGWMPLSAAVTLLFLPVLASAQNPRVARINTIDASSSQRITGSVSAITGRAADAGHLEAATQITAMTLHFQPTAAQQADLQQLLVALHDPKSTEYHQWLTPQAFNERFGVADADVARTSAWLRSAGFTVVDATPMRVEFSGSAKQVEAAFGTELHHYKTSDQEFYSNATELSIPTALEGVVSGVTGIDSYRPHGNYAKYLHSAAVTPGYTTTTGFHAVVPADVRTIYDVNALYTAGFTGAGKTMVIIGQSAIAASDISDFHTLFGGNANLQQTLVPSTGTSTFRAGDQGESDLDLEYSGSIAKDATINLVYAGSSSNIFTAIQYAITQNLAPVISVSYGECEAALSVSSKTAYDTLYAQGNTQGQTLVVSTGDAGATECDSTALESASSGLAIQFPSSSPYVTAVGGTEFSEGSGTYWNSTNDSSYGSALSYIPEVVWNDTVENGSLAAGGGGVSKLYAKPSWQVAPGVPADGMRDVPDLSLDASNDHDPYFYCTSDSGASPCSKGTAYEAGGTSFAAPIFAGMLTLFNEATASTGYGNFNTTLYPLFGTKPSAFHDITVGNNNSPCNSGSTNCPAGTTSIGYSAATGYDLATGLGTIDATVLAAALPGYGSGKQASVSLTAVSFLPASPYPTQTIAVSAKITGGSGTPTGTVQFYVDGTASGMAVTIASGTAAFSSAALAAGVHDVTAKYSGDTTFAPSAGTGAVTVQTPAETGTVLTLSSATPNTVSTLTVNATVTTSAGTATTATGTMAFLLDGVALGSAVPVTNGVATVSLGQLSAAKHTVQGTYSGSTSLASSVGFQGFTVSTGTASTVAVNVSPATPNTAQAVMVTAVIPATATGTVQFALDGTVTGSAAVSNGQAYLSLGKLTAGGHTLVSTYTGDVNFGTSSISSSFSVVAAPSTSSAFTLSATNVSVQTNQSASSTVTITSSGTYAGTVKLNVSGVIPTNVCYSVSGSPTVTSNTSTTATVTIYAGSNCATTSNVRSILQAQNSTGDGMSAKGVAFAMLGGFGLLAGFARKRRFAVALCGVLLTVVLGSMAGCSSGAAATPSIAGTYTLTVAGTDSVTTTNTASTTFTLTIQ